jgi:ribosomal small subunit protein bTHX
MVSLRAGTPCARNVGACDKQSDATSRNLILSPTPRRRHNPPFHRENTMGNGDKRSFKGKVFKGSYGKTRPRNKKKAAAGTAKRK